MPFQDPQAPMKFLSCLLISVCLAAKGSVVIAQTPVDVENAQTFFRDGGLTAKESTDADLKFWLQLIRLYEKHSKDEGAIRESAAGFITDSIMIDYGEWEIAALQSQEDQLFEQAETLVDAGTKDPIVLCYCVDVLLRKSKGTEARAVAKRAVAVLKASDYPQEIQILALDRLYRASRVVVGVKAIAKARKEMVESGADWFQWASQSKGWQRPAWKYFDGLIDIEPMYNPSKSVRRARIDDLDAVAIKYQELSDSDPWVVEMLNGSSQQDLAWHFRGSGYAKTVSKKNWALFEKHESKASEHFIKANQLQPKFPESSYEMISVCQGGDDFGSDVEWFARCVEAEVDYFPAYERMLVYQSSRWGGGQDAMMSFSNFCLASERYDTLVPYAYLKGLHTIHVLEEVPWQKILNRPGVFANVEEMLTKLVNHPLRSVAGGRTKSQAQFLTELLCLCLNAEKYDKACKLFEELGDQVSTKTMADFGLHNTKYYRSRSYAYLEFFDELDVFRKKTMFARELREHSKEYHDFYVDLHAKSQDPRTELFYQSLIARTQMELDFHDGKWVDLTFDPDFTHWSGNSIHWEYESPSSAFVSNQKQGAHMQMYHYSDFPGPKEVVAEVELITKGSAAIGVGISVGPMNGRFGGRLFYVDPLKNKRGVVSNGPDPTGWDSDNITKPSRLHLKFWEPEKFAFYTNGFMFELKSDKDFLQKPGFEKFKIGLGEQSWSTDNGVVRFKNVRVRKLTMPPLPDDANEQSIKYYQDALKREPYFSHYRMLGNIYFALERYEDVATAYQAAADILPADLDLAYDLGDCLTRLAKFQPALDQFTRVYKDKKARFRAESTSFMAMIYASAPDGKFRDAGRALKLAQEAMGFGKKKSGLNFLGLGLAQGANGDFDSAIKSLIEAKKLARDKYNVRLIESAISAFEKDEKFELPQG